MWTLDAIGRRGTCRMFLEVIGTNHHDPFGPDQLLAELNRLKDQHGNPPCFVGVEFDLEYLDDINEQRRIFGQLAPQVLQLDDSGIIDRLAATLFYEAVVAQDIFPDTLLIGLDRINIEYDFLMGCQAQTRLALFRERYLQGRSLPMAPQDLLGALSQAARQHAEANLATRHAGGAHDVYARDIKFAWIILERIALGRLQASWTSPEAWSLAIVGAAHADEDDPCSTISLLRRTSLACAAHILGP